MPKGRPRRIGGRGGPGAGRGRTRSESAQEVEVQEPDVQLPNLVPLDTLRATLTTSVTTALAGVVEDTVNRQLAALFAAQPGAPGGIQLGDFVLQNRATMGAQPVVPGVPVAPSEAGGVGSGSGLKPDQAPAFPVTAPAIAPQMGAGTQVPVGHCRATGPQVVGGQQFPQMTAGGNPQAVAGPQMSQNQMMTGPQMAGVAANQMVTGQQMPGAPQMMFSPRGPSGVQLVPGPQTAVADQAAAVGDPESGLRPGSGSLAQPAMMLGTCTPAIPIVQPAEAHQFVGGVGSLAPISVGFQLDYAVSTTLRNAIWAHEYVAFGDLLNPTDKSQRALAVKDDGTNELCWVPGTKKLPRNIQEWQSAFAIFQVVYTRKYPGEIQDLITYGERIRDLASEGGDFNAMDQRSAAAVPQMCS